MSAKELIKKASLQRCQSSIVLHFDRPQDEQRDLRYYVRKEIINNLNAEGRTKETITWIEGWYLFGKTFPLDPMFGKTQYWRIIGYCYIPKI